MSLRESMGLRLALAVIAIGGLCRWAARGAQGPGVHKGLLAAERPPR
jgi:hypothetical protein